MWVQLDKLGHKVSKENQEMSVCQVSTNSVIIDRILTIGSKQPTCNFTPVLLLCRIRWSSRRSGSQW